MRPIAYLFLCFLAGCASISVSKTIATGYKVAIDYNARTDRMIDAGAIDKPTAQRRVDNVSKAKVGLDAATKALSECRAAKIPDNECWKAAASATAARALLQEVEVGLVKQP